MREPVLSPFRPERFVQKRANIGMIIAASILIGGTLVSATADASVKPKGNAQNYSYPVLVKEASSLKGQRVVHTACIFQFDSNTGTKDFLAEWTNLGSGVWDNDVNVRLPTASVGAKAFEKDLVTIQGYILGNLSYQTQSGGTNTVPNLEATSVTVVGHNCS